jgi:hypothetical protein
LATLNDIIHMAHFSDLSICSYVGFGASSPCLAVGWLEPQEEFSRGDVPVEFFRRLCQFLIESWSFVASGGAHPCGLCRFTGGGGSSFENLHVAAFGSGMLFVPSGSTLYVSPTSIAHYIDAHGYSPPVEFQRAVMECPEMRSIVYMRALLATLAREWIQKAHEPIA